MVGLIPMAIAFVVAYWFFVTAKRAELKDNEPWIWAFLGGLAFYAVAKLSMYLTTQIFVVTLISGSEPSMPRLFIVGLGCVLGMLFSIFVHAKFLPIKSKKDK
jgi:drug/metabolite transporter (DMT)-like permease